MINKINSPVVIAAANTGTAAASGIISSNDTSQNVWLLYSSFVMGGVGAIVLYYHYKWNRQHKNNPKTKTITVPFAYVGMFETMEQFFGPDSPHFLLRIAREVKHTSGRTCYRLPIHIPGGFYVVGDIETQRTILMDHTSDKSYIIGMPFHTVFGSTKSIFTSSSMSDHWKYIRKSTAYAFSSAQVSRMKTIAIQHTNRWCEDARIKFCSQPFDPAHEMSLLAFQILCEGAFEYIVSVEESIAFAHDLECALKEYLTKAADPIRRSMGWFIPSVRLAQQACTRAHAFAYKLLYTYRNNPNKSSENTLIKLLSENEAISDQQKVAEIMSYLIGGHDTSGYSMASTLVLLASHPEVVTKLRSDVKGMSADQWCKLSPFFQHVLKETFRIKPVIALGSARTLGRDYKTTKEGEILPKHAIAFLPQVLPNRSDDVFNQPDTFDPSRWYNATDTMKACVMPFSAGNRNCIGQSFGIAELENILPIILSRFELQLIQKGVEEYFLAWKYKNYLLQLKEI